MSVASENAEKIHYICQTYVVTKGAKGRPAGLKIDKQFQYTTGVEAQRRAERENERESCAGADAYMVVEDAGSGEVSSPTFIARLGNVPEDEF